MDLFDELFNKEMKKLIQTFKISWQRPFSEKDGFGVTKSDDHEGNFLVFNTLGVDPKDISVKFRADKDDYGNNGVFITVKGETVVNPLNVKYSVNNTIFYPCPEGTELGDPQYKTMNGLTVIYVKSKIREDMSEFAKKIEDGEDFEW